MPQMGAAEILPGTPIGETLPAFTVHAIRGGLTILRRGAHSHGTGVVVNNLSDTPYTEFANAAFFRPKPRRSLIVTYTLTY